MSDGTVTENDPDQQTSFWFASDGSPFVSIAFYGGHDNYVISDEIAALLTAEGYTVGGDPGPPPGPTEPPVTVANAILLESGDPILLESGDPILLESA
jgi:hypothetical protein